MAIHRAAPSLWDTVHFCCVFVSLAMTGPQIYAHGANSHGDHGVQQTAIIDNLPSRQRREIKREILTLLGLDHKPKPVPNVKQNSAPQFMLDLYNSLQEDEEDVVPQEGYLSQHNVTLQATASDQRGADMVMSFVNHAGKAAKTGYETKYLFYFDFSEVPATETVTGAELRIYKKPARKMADRQPFLIEFFKFISGRGDSEKYILEPEVNITVQADERGWLHLNTKKAATQWAYFPAENHGLYMKVTDKHGVEVEPHDVGLVGRRGPKDRQPFLVAFFKADHKLHVRKTRAARRESQKERDRSRRGKRRREEKVSYREERSPYSSAHFNPQSYMSQPSSRCGRRQLYVSFKDLGWQDWIIAPEGYTAYYCYGQCQFPLHAHMNATNHAIVQVLVHITRRPNKPRPPMPCCAPRTLSPINVLYFDDNSNVILKKYRNMVAKECGCQ